VARVADALYEAGRRRYWLNQTEPAIRLLKQARRLHRDHPPTYWYLADLWLGQSYRDAPPYAIRAFVRRAEVCWDLGERIGPPEHEFSWAFLTRALICTQRMRLPGADQMAEAWHAVVALERSFLLHDSADEVSWRHWTALAFVHRLLNNPGAALRALDHIDEDTADQLEVLDERTVALTETGADQEAEQLAERRRGIERSSWIEAVQALLLMRRRRHHEALEILRRISDQEPAALWYRQLKAYCQRRLGQVDAAVAGYRELWERRRDPGYHESLDSIAFTGYTLATLSDPLDRETLAEATVLLETLCQQYEQRPHEHPSLQINLGLCLLAAGDLAAGAARVRRGIGLCLRDHEVVDVLEDLGDLRELSAGWPEGEALVDVLEGLERLAERHRVDLDGMEVGPELELRRTAGADADGTGWPTVGSQAGLARLEADRRRWASAAHWYRRLWRATPERFPEAIRALRRVADGLRDDGDDAMRRPGRRAAQPEDPAIVRGPAPIPAAERRRAARQALRRYAQALALARTSGVGDAEQLAGLHARAAFAWLELGEFSRAASVLSEAAQHWEKVGITDLGPALGEVATGLVGGVTDAWAMDDHWAAFGRDPDPARAELAAAVRAALRADLERRFELAGGDPELLIPVVTPIALELGNALVAEDTSPEWSLFKTYIPGMRDSIRQGLGIIVPGVRVRSAPALAPGGYVIKLDEATEARGEVVIGARWCPAPMRDLVAAGAPKEALVETTHPGTGATGCWVSPDGWTPVTAAGLPIQAEPLELVVEHLGAVLRRHAVDFLGIQECEQCFEEWQQEPAVAALLDAVAPEHDRVARFRLARALRALAAEAVPVTAASDILESVRQTGLTTASGGRLLHDLRLRLRPVLPGNGPPWTRRDLPAEWEAELLAGLDRGGDAPVLALDPERVHALLTTLRDWWDGGGQRLALVVSDAELRPLVRRLIAGQLPGMAVLSAEEVLPVETAGHRSAAATAERTGPRDGG
jgi:tetratricopeptide (TPR) repeat protein